MICAACAEPLGDPWDQCNATPDVSYHRDCCPGCAQPPREPAPVEFTHGTISGYANYGCRCDDCRAVDNAARRRRYATRPKAQRNTRRGVRT